MAGFRHGLPVFVFSDPHVTCLPTGPPEPSVGALRASSGVDMPGVRRSVHRGWFRAFGDRNRLGVTAAKAAPAPPSTRPP